MSCVQFTVPNPQEGEAGLRVVLHGVGDLRKWSGSSFPGVMEVVDAKIARAGTPEPKKKVVSDGAAAAAAVSGKRKSSDIYEDDSAEYARACQMVVDLTSSALETEPARKKAKKTTKTAKKAKKAKKNKVSRAVRALAAFNQVPAEIDGEFAGTRQKLVSRVAYDMPARTLISAEEASRDAAAEERRARAEHKKKTAAMIAVCYAGNPAWMSSQRHV